MLVLSRKVGQEIVIDGEIRVCVVAINGNKVRLGVTAPDSTRVDRREIHQRRGEFTALPQDVGHVQRCVAGGTEPGGGANS